MAGQGERGTGLGPAVPTQASVAVLRPAANGGFRFRDGFWGARQRVVRVGSLPHAIRCLFEFGSLENLRRVVSGEQGEHRGRIYADSDVYKVMEAAAWEFGNVPSAAIDRRLAAGTALLRRAQDGDGYLNSWFQSASSPPRYSDLAMGHEMYCAGHLIQAAVARWRATGKDDLLDVATQFADNLVERFGDGGLAALCGHPLIESALVELYRTTGQDRYLDLAIVLLDRRGSGLLGPGLFGSPYYQDDIGIRDATTLRGHCVRALYLAAGATDVYLETGDKTLLVALERQWEHTIATKTYLTGGMGCRRKDEAFGAPFELPPDQAFAETCAAVAAVMWSWRMLLATGNSKYADFIERVLFNVVATALSIDGTDFFYVNTLHRRRGAVESGYKIARRQPWFRCACCPPNLMRLVTSLGFYIATATPAGIQIHQYAAGMITCDVQGDPLVFDVATDYPWSGTVRVTVLEAPPSPCSISFRWPSWCDNLSVRVNGEPLPVTRGDMGYVTLTRPWRVGDALALDLAMPPRFTVADRRIDAVRGCVAVERGPLVYCLEQVDLATERIEDINIDPCHAIEPVTVPGLPSSTMALQARAVRLSTAESGWPYGFERRASSGTKLTVTLVPYHAWSNRSDGPMRVWIPTTGH